MRQHSAITNIPRRIRETPFEGVLHKTVFIIYISIETGGIFLDFGINVQYNIKFRCYFLATVCFMQYIKDHVSFVFELSDFLSPK